MIIGVPRERKILEKRVALTPAGAAELVKRGHRVIVETGAGAGSHFYDEEYVAAGASIVPTLAQVWNEAGMVVKVKEPAAEEFEFFRPGLAIFDYLHLAGLPEVAAAMLEGGVTGIAYELVRDADGHLPLLAPMSEIAGKLAVINGSYYLLAQNGGRGLLPGEVGGVPQSNVVVVGAGVAGSAACEYAVGMGASVTLLDVSADALKRAASRFPGKIEIRMSTDETLAAACREADLVIGAVLVPGAAAPKVIKRKHVRAMKQGAVIVDISVDQGGCVETTRVTSLKEPVYEVDGVIHYAVPNMPAQAPLSSTRALTAATFPYLLMLVENGVEQALKESTALMSALNTYRGQVTNAAVAEALHLDYAQPVFD